MTDNTRLIIPLMLMFFFSASFSFADCIKGSGNIISETRDVGIFHSIDIRTIADVYITQSEERHLKIEGDDNILSLLLLEVKNGTLVIRTRQCVKEVTSMKIYTSMNEIKGVVIAGAGDVYSDGKLVTDTIELDVSGAGDVNLQLDANIVKTKVSGAGDIILSGKAKTHHVKIDGAGDVKTFGLETQNTDIELSGAGNCQVNVSKELLINASGVGSVEYKGDAAVHKNISGIGRVKKVD